MRNRPTLLSRISPNGSKIVALLSGKWCQVVSEIGDLDKNYDFVAGKDYTLTFHAADVPTATTVAHNRGNVTGYLTFQGPRQGLSRSNPDQARKSFSRRVSTRSQSQPVPVGHRSRHSMKTCDPGHGSLLISGSRSESSSARSTRSNELIRLRPGTLRALIGSDRAGLRGSRHAEDCDLITESKDASLTMAYVEIPRDRAFQHYLAALDGEICRAVAGHRGGASRRPGAGKP